MGQFTSSRKIDRTANKENCLAALKCTRCFVQTCGPLIPSNQHKVLQAFVLPILLEICQAAAVYPVPYADGECRKELYHLLLSLVLKPSLQWPAPTQCAVQLFSIGQGDENTMVSSFCRESLGICECFIHPRTPSYNFPVSSADVQAV